jgi:hypothetical protein
MDELEALLRQFQPRRPKPLPDDGDARRFRPLVWVAASGLAAAVVTMLVRHEPTPVVEAPAAVSVTLGALNAHAVRSAEDLDKALTRTSSAILPDIERPGGVLHALSKE